MKSCGLIVEYNPMHLGHLYHLKQAQKITQADVTIAVMSGSVVQRGDFSIIDKFIKTDVALKTGIDIVVELPSFFVLQAADYFAKAAVDLLAALKIDHLVFGSESGELTGLKRLEQTMQEPGFDEALKSALDAGLSYPDAMHQAVKDPSLKSLLTPNNTLGISYLKALRAYPDINVQTIKREKRMYYDAFDDHTTIQSATALRDHIHQGIPVTDYVVEALKPYLESLNPLKADQLYPLFIGQLKMMTPPRFNALFGFQEGLENRFLKAATEDDYFDFLEAVKTPRYTYAHLQRAMMHLLLATPKAFEHEKTPPYIRLLGMSEQGQRYLHQIKKDIPLPVYTSAKNQQHPMLDFEQRISSLIEPYVKRPLKQLELSPPIQIAK
jgi:predicted nucleotidyltransferase